MPKSYTTLEITRAICYRTMDAWDFSYAKRLEWEIYGSRHQTCPVCDAIPQRPCYNMADVKYNSTRPQKLRRVVRNNKRAHNERIDWDRITAGLKHRGYWRQTLEDQIRRQLHENFKGTEEELTETRPMPDWAKGE